MSAWGRWDDELDPALLLDLQAAYVRRQRWEARMAAVELVNALNEALSAGASTTGRAGGAIPPSRVGNSGKRYAETSFDGMLAHMGAKFN